MSLLRRRALLRSLAGHLNYWCQSCMPHRPEMCFLSCPLQKSTRKSDPRWPLQMHLSLRLQRVTTSGGIANPHQLDCLLGSCPDRGWRAMQAHYHWEPESMFYLEVLRVWPCPLHHHFFDVGADPCHHFLGDHSHRRPLAPWALVLGVREMAHACSTRYRCGCCTAVDLRGHA